MLDKIDDPILAGLGDHLGTILFTLSQKDRPNKTQNWTGTATVSVTPTVPESET